MIKKSHPSTKPVPEYVPVEKPLLKKDVFVDSCDLPANYNTTNLTLMVRDPQWIYAYWDIAPSSIEEIRKKIGDELNKSCRILRIYDVAFVDFNGSNANSFFDIDVGPHTNNWYINLWSDNITYCAELGFRMPDGRFFAITRSNFVTTPRGGSSNRSSTIWMDVKNDLSKQAFVTAETQKEESKGPSSHKQSSPLESKKSKRKIFLTEDDIRAYYSRFLPLLKHARRASDKRLNHILLGDKLKEGIFIEDYLIQGLSMGGASESLLGGASERKDKKRKFFFEIGMELIVYGRTEPDAEVWLGDKKIKLRGDGTFSLRFVLPDGQIPLAFVAESSDKVEKRSIKTSIERKKTAYEP